jgi:hypothetical protein
MSLILLRCSKQALQICKESTEGLRLPFLFCDEQAMKTEGPCVKSEDRPHFLNNLSFKGDRHNNGDDRHSDGYNRRVALLNLACP